MMKNLRATAAAATMNFAQTHADTKKFQVSRQDPKCPEVKLGIPKPTSGHLKENRRSRCPDVGLGNLDFIFRTIAKNTSRKIKPTSGHQRRPTDAIDQQKRRRRSKTDTKTSSTSKPCKTIGFAWVSSTLTFLVRFRNDGILNGAGATSTFLKKNMIS